MLELAAINRDRKKSEVLNYTVKVTTLCPKKNIPNIIDRTSNKD